MGRKKRRAIRSQTPTPAVVVNAKGGQNDEEDATDVVHAEDATDVVPITSTRKNTNKKQRRNEYNQFDPDTNSPNDESFPQSPIRSSWFAEVKWISRHNHHDHQSHQTALQNTEGTSMPTNIISTKVNDATNTPKEDSPPSSSLSSSHTPNESNPLPTNNAHDSLLSELNKLKQQLMPTAKICADAINTNNKYSQTNSNKTTNPGYEFRRARSICNPYECLGETFSKNHRKKKNNKKRNYYRQQQSSSGLSQFVNRSAIKLANVDALLGFCLTSTSSKNTARRQHQEHPRNSKVSAHPDEMMKKKNNNNFVFVDLCGGPGGFSEYILYRHVHRATLPDNDQGRNSTDNRRHDCSNTDDDGGVQSCYGFGMSLSGSNDDGKGVPWDLNHLKQYHLHFNNNNSNNASVISNGSVKEKLCYHVCNGVDNTGSIYNWDNVIQLQRDILTTAPPGKRGDIIHSGSHNAPPLANLVVADGGFDAQRDSNNQEAVAHKIIVSQTAAALALLRPGGIFVLKMFGFREEGTRRMLRYMYGCFDKMTFVKPILSRPASAERYLVCHGYSGPEMGWDGLIWRERMMMVLPPSAVISREEETASREYAPLEEFMDSFDLEMLQLNIDTCTSIINNLSDKSAAQGEDGTSGHGKRIHNLDLKVYEAAWQLF